MVADDESGVLVGRPLLLHSVRHVLLVAKGVIQGVHVVVVVAILFAVQGSRLLLHDGLFGLVQQGAIIFAVVDEPGNFTHKIFTKKLFYSRTFMLYKKTAPLTTKNIFPKKNWGSVRDF